ncbi:MAG: hypothetical protein ACSW75_05675 [Lachnospiraceae bacterium]
MQKLKSAVLRFFLLQKRFFKRKLYLAILLAAPFLVLAMRIAATEDAGILHVVLCRTGEDPEGSDALADKLLSLNGIIRYTEVPTVEEGQELVRQKKADCLLTLPSNLAQGIDDFLRGKNGALSMFVREDSITIQLIREQIFGYLQPLLVERAGLRFINRQDIFKDADKDALAKEYHELIEKREFDNIFRISYIDNSDYDPNAANYLTSPLRGLLAVYLLLFAIASALFYLQDAKSGTFAWTPFARRPLFPFTYILNGTLPGMVAVLVGLALSGSFTSFPRELLLAVIYTITSAAFATILLAVFPDLRALGALTPILLMVTLVIAPVFVDIRSLTVFQHLLPTFYYLASLHSDTILMHSFIYLAIVFVLASILLVLRRRRPGKL